MSPSDRRLTLELSFVRFSQRASLASFTDRGQLIYIQPLCKFSAGRNGNESNRLCHKKEFSAHKCVIFVLSCSVVFSFLPNRFLLYWSYHSFVSFSPVIMFLFAKTPVTFSGDMIPRALFGAFMQSRQRRIYIQGMMLLQELNCEVQRKMKLEEYGFLIFEM